MQGCRRMLLGNLSIDDELDDDDDASYPRKTGARVLFLAGKLKVKQTVLWKDDNIYTHNKFGLFMAFKDVRNWLLISHDNGLINDEEFIVVYDLYSSRDPDFPYDMYAPFDLDKLDESESIAEFRFHK